MVIIHDEHTRLSHMMTTYDNRIRWSYTVIMYNYHRWWSYLMLIHDNHIWWPHTIIDHLIWSSSVIIISGHHIRPSVQLWQVRPVQITEKLNWHRPTRACRHEDLPEVVPNNQMLNQYMSPPGTPKPIKHYHSQKLHVPEIPGRVFCQKKSPCGRPLVR